MFSLHVTILTGTTKERGLDAWHVKGNGDDTPLDTDVYDEGYDVYTPLIPERWLRWKFVKYIPFLPYKNDTSGTIDEHV